MQHARSNIARLRGKLDPHHPAIAMASHNPLSAKLAAEAGSDAIWGSGFEPSTAYAVPAAAFERKWDQKATRPINLHVVM